MSRASRPTKWCSLHPSAGGKLLPLRYAGSRFGACRGPAGEADVDVAEEQLEVLKTSVQFGATGVSSYTMIGRYRRRVQSLYAAAAREKGIWPVISPPRNRVGRPVGRLVGVSPLTAKEVRELCWNFATFLAWSEAHVSPRVRATRGAVDGRTVRPTESPKPAPAGRQARRAGAVGSARDMADWTIKNLEDVDSSAPEAVADRLESRFALAPRLAAPRRQPVPL